MKKEKSFKSVEAQRFIDEVQAVINSNLARSFSEVAKKVGFSSQDFTDIKTGKKDIQRDFLEAITAFYKIDKKFILTGERIDPIAENNSQITHRDTDSKFYPEGSERNNLVAEPETLLSGKVAEPVNAITTLQRYISPGHDPIPVYDDTDDLENITGLLKDPQKKPVILLMKGHLGCNVVIRHNDTAMDKDFPPKCQLGIQRVNNFKKRIIPGMAAIIELEDFTITRYVFEGSNKNEFLLRSADPDLFPDMKVEITDIKTMWKIKSVTPVAVPKILMY